MAEYFTDIYNDSTHQLSSMQEEQLEIGRGGARRLVRMAPSTVLSTIFADKAKMLRERFALFRIQDCISTTLL